MQQEKLIMLLESAESTMTYYANQFGFAASDIKNSVKLSPSMLSALISSIKALGKIWHQSFIVDLNNLLQLYQDEKSHDI